MENNSICTEGVREAVGLVQAASGEDLTTVEVLRKAEAMLKQARFLVEQHGVGGRVPGAAERIATAADQLDADAVRAGALALIADVKGLPLPMLLQL